MKKYQDFHILAEIAIKSQLTDCIGVWPRSYFFSSSSDFNLERTLATNHSFEVVVVTRQPIPRSVHLTNGTRVLRTTIVANDPADFSRNSFAQRTLNDLLAAQGHSAARIDLLRLVGADTDAVSMSDLVHFLVADGVLKHVRQLHLTVYIGRWQSHFFTYLSHVRSGTVKKTDSHIFHIWKS